MHKLIEEAEDVFAQALRVRECVRAKVQLECSHPQVLEGDYRPSSSSNFADPPFRVCCTCGFAEEGWSCGYTALGNTPRRLVAHVNRDMANATRRGLLHANPQFNGIARRGFSAAYEAAVKRSFPKAFGE